MNRPQGHHHNEEENLFPQIAKITGEPGIMEQNVEQHREYLT
jgi:hemerythrin superfamily protein